MTLARGVGLKVGRRRFMAPASLSPSGQDCWVGVPSKEHILKSWSA